jgi:hypothetical protein
MDVEFFFDPVCTWSWITSRWLVEVAQQRGLRLYWRSFSKLIGQGTRGVLDWELTSRTASHRALRMIEAVRVDHPGAIGDLYTALLTQAIAEQAELRPPFCDLPVVLAEVGLDRRYAGSAYDERWDEVIRESMADARAVVGEGAGTPVTVLWLDNPVGFQGPLISPAPIGAEALGLWDAFVTLASVPGAFEISGPHPQPPELQATWSALQGAATGLPFLHDDDGR